MLQIEIAANAGQRVKLDAPRPDPVAQPGSDSADRYLMLFDRLAGEVRASQKARRGAYAGAGTLPVPATQPLS